MIVNKNINDFSYQEIFLFPNPRPILLKFNLPIFRLTSEFKSIIRPLSKFSLSHLFFKVSGIMLLVSLVINIPVRIGLDFISIFFTDRLYAEKIFQITEKVIRRKTPDDFSYYVSGDSFLILNTTLNIPESTFGVLITTIFISNPPIQIMLHNILKRRKCELKFPIFYLFCVIIHRNIALIACF